MAALLAFAFVSGIVTILSPCILPVLPIVLSGGVTGGKARPFGVVAGFVASFAIFTLALTAIVQAVGISPDALRIVAVVLIVAFGLVMLVPPLRELLERGSSRLAGWGRRSRPDSPPRAGFWAGLPVGVGLGLVWTPCVGPIMASVITLALTRRVDGGAVFITLAYTLGTALPMLAVMLGGRALIARVPGLARNAARIQRVFGALMIVVGLSIAFGLDRRFQAAILTVFPNYGSGLTGLEQAAPVKAALEARAGGGGAARGNSAGGTPSVFTGASGRDSRGGKLGDYGQAPDFAGRGNWINSAPLTLDDLRGKVVVVDFWTYSCVNCVRTIPYLRAWHEAYRDQGLVIVGVHSPEFEFEKNPANVERAMRELGVSWPVVQDNDFAEWTAWGNQYWPAHYFIDATGRVRYYHFGEGAYDESERVIQALLREAGASVGGLVSKPDLRLDARTAETYLGYQRGNGFASDVSPVADAVTSYRASGTPSNGEWSLHGRWTIAGEYVVPESAGSLELGFNARDVYLVVEPEAPGGSIGVLVDGQKVADTSDVTAGVLVPGESRLYHMVGLRSAGPHVLRLEVKGKLRLFAFTFG